MHAVILGVVLMLPSFAPMQTFSLNKRVMNTLMHACINENHEIAIKKVKRVKNEK